MFRRNLLPHMHVVKLIGGTGDGKTEFAIVFADPKARKVLKRCVGRTNSTVRERIFVYTTGINSNVIIVAVKPAEKIFERMLFSEMVVSAIAKVVILNGKLEYADLEQAEQQFEVAMKTLLLEKNNTCAVLNFLSEDQKDDFVKKILNIYHKYMIAEKNFELYNATMNKIAEKGIKENSNKFIEALKLEIQREISVLGDNFKNELENVWNETNDILKTVFFEYFDEKNKSEDELYYKELDLDNPDVDFIEAMFTANNLQEGERLSLEVLCEQIFIYAPMNDAVKTIVESNTAMKNIFTDEYGNITLGIFDTRGLFHTGAKVDNGDYLNEMIYNGDTDAIAMVVPLQGDPNERNIYDLYRKMLENLKKQIPVFMINNKVDMFLDQLSKDNYDQDPFSTDEQSNSTLSAEEEIGHIDTRVNELQRELQEAQSKSRKNMNIIPLPCYLKRDKRMNNREVLQRYNIACVVQKMLETIAVHLEETAYKIPVRSNGMDVIIDETKLGNCIHQHILDPNTNKKVFAPACMNIRDNLGICPHGNSYNALRRRVRCGDGYSCKIDEAYYYYCKSFSIEFTGNLRNFLSDDFIKNVLATCVSIDNAEFIVKADKGRFLELIRSNINAKRFVSILLYDKAMIEGERFVFGFEAYFQGFLRNSAAYFIPNKINEDDYVYALKCVLQDAINKTISLSVIYK